MLSASLFLFVAAGVPARSFAAPAEEGAEAVPPEPWRPGTTGPFVAFTAELPPPGKLVLQPLLFIYFEGGRFDSRGHGVPADGTARGSLFQLYAEWAPGEHWSAGALVEVQLNHRAVGGRSSTTVGFADTLVFGRYAPLTGRVGPVPDLALMVQVRVPTGKADRLAPEGLETDRTGTGSWAFIAGGDATWFMKPIIAHAELLFDAPFEAELDGIPTRPGPSLSWALALEVPLPGLLGLHRLALMSEMSGQHQTSTRQNGAKMPGSVAQQISFDAGLELIFSEAAMLMAGYERQFWGRNTAELDILAFTLVMTF
jgi:hypothetical protein